jgi:hypothetical protein
MHWWLVLFPLSVVCALIPGLPPWMIMNLIAGVTLLILKTVTLQEFCRHPHQPLSPVDIISWYALWPGLNAREFLAKPHTNLPKATAGDWILAASKTAVGALTLTCVAPQIASRHPVIGGWLALASLLLMIHFGVFHLLALTWRNLGRSVQPIMQRPLCAKSINDFWSRRWNLAFRDFANLFVMRPLARRWNGTVAMWGCFTFSGLVHELAISFPVHAGYGLPLAYFWLQALAVSCERSTWGKKLGMREGWTGWLFACIIIGPPSLLLFHPPFVTAVVLPLVGIAVTKS